jgi:hypothetical protein
MIRKAITALAALFLVVGCTTVDPVTGEREPNRTANGAIIGAIVGAAAGTLAGGDDRRNAMIGAGIGALGGAAIGNYMDRTYQNLRERLAGTGVGVERVSQSQIRLIFPSDLTFDFNRDTVKSQFTGTLRDTGSVLRTYEHNHAYGVEMYRFVAVPLSMQHRVRNDIGIYLAARHQDGAECSDENCSHLPLRC